MKITSEIVLPKDEVVHINELLEQEEVDKLIHSLSNKEKFFKGLATVNLTEEELESVLLKYKFKVETYVENSLAPEILDLILIKGTLHSFYKKLENVTYLDLFWYKN